MSLKLFNSMSRAKELFVPIQPGKARMYVCGMTVYDHSHLGHARSIVVFDVLARWLRASGYALTHVRNITDIDDKIIRRANENHESIRELTERFTLAMREDAAALGALPPDFEPKASEHIPEMIALIEALERKNLAYFPGNGDAYFSSRQFPDYGKLSGKPLDDLIAGARVASDPRKRDPLDFALWKGAKDGEPFWLAPWGKGRPGWHIECSAMSHKLLGETFDIHGGGLDLQFPHHDNEIAQSEGAHGSPLARYWIHNGFVQEGERKMGKSENNFVTIRDALKSFDGETLRFFILRSHYRKPLAHSKALIEEAHRGLGALYRALKDTPPGEYAPDWENPFAWRFRAALNDDINTAGAIAALFELAAEIHKTNDPALRRQLRALGNLIGLLHQDAQVFAHAGTGLDETMIENLIARRAKARTERLFEESDRIRAELLAQGVIIEDSPASTTWRRA